MKLIIDDEKLSISISRFFEKLEKYYPEHQIFALDSIDKDLRERLGELYKKVGYETSGEFLAAYGFQMISGDEVRKIRNGVLYTPGNEPDIIKGKVENMLRRLREYYPDGKISRGLQNDHKSLSKSVSGLYQWLGYDNASSMLEAYGFEVEYAVSGRSANDYQELISFLQQKYSGPNKLKSIGLLIHDNPEYAAQIKTLQNRASELFGMGLSKYLKQIGVLSSSEKNSETTCVIKKKYIHYLIVSVDGENVKIPCVTNTRTIKIGDYIEMCGLHDHIKLIGRVEETHYYTEEEKLPCPLESMQQYTRKLLKSELKEIANAEVQYTFCSVQIQNHNSTLYYLSPYDDIEAGDRVIVPHKWYGMVDGIVTEVKYVTEKTAPYPVKKTRKIVSITEKASAEKVAAEFAVEKITKVNPVKDFILRVINPAINEKYVQCTYFASAVFRGLDVDVLAALRVIHPSSFDIRSYKKDLGEGIGQFECESVLVPKIIKQFPNLKCIFFAEDWKEKNVYLAYSESGYDTVTSYRLIGNCNFYCRDRWSLIHDPSEKNFSFEGGQYEFLEISKWEKLDYVLPNRVTQLVGETLIPSEPYKKKTMNDPCQIIEICYPDN